MRAEKTTFAPNNSTGVRGVRSSDNGIESRTKILRNESANSNMSAVDTLGTELPRHNVVLRFTDPGSEQEYDALLQEQARLAKKKVVENLERSEALQLQMIRWAIDRVENGRMSSDIDKLETLVSLHEKLAAEITRLVAAVQPHQ